MLVDISYHNTDAGPINWAVADRSIDGVYMKITEGLSLVDPAWQTDYAGAGKQGIPRGAYHFGDGNDPVREADHFADQYLLHEWELDPVLDIESSWAKPAWLRSFRTQFRKRMAAAGRSARFRVYSSHSLLTGVLDPIAWIDSTTTIWAARYARTLGWDHPQLVLWQNTSTATVPGFVGSVDEDQYQHGWTPAADQGGQPPVTSPIDKLTAADVALLKGVAQRYAPGNTAGSNPAGDMAGVIFALQGQIASAVETITGALSDLAADVAAIQQKVDAQQPATLTGTAQVTVQLNPESAA